MIFSRGPTEVREKDLQPRSHGGPGGRISPDDPPVYDAPGTVSVIQDRPSDHGPEVRASGR
jgi:hypothetical protein